MIKIIKKTPLLGVIKQILRKQKYIFKFRYTNKKEINLLEFLWINKYISGFSSQKISNTKSNLLIIYLKIDETDNKWPYFKVNVSQTKQNLQKMKKWSKNSFFIIITTKGILNIQKSLNHRIGGFVWSQLY